MFGLSESTKLGFSGGLRVDFGFRGGVWGQGWGGYSMVFWGARATRDQITSWRASYLMAGMDL